MTTLEFNRDIAVKKIFSIMAFFLLSFNLFGQRKMEVLDRGLFAVKVSNGVYINWRLKGEELHAVAFNIYRDGTKLNNELLVGATNYTDQNGSISSSYSIGTVVDEIELTVSDEVTVWENQYIDIPARQINGGYSTYSINDGSVGDLDGDGQYEIVVKRLALNMTRESTDYHYLEAYELDGTFLWAINIGPNIYNDKEFNFLVYDFDEDGKAEIATRTSEGTIDGLGDTIPDIDGDGITNYRYSITDKNTGYGFRAEGPDFISVFDGETGKEIARDTYIEREPIIQWGLPGHDIGQLSHRSTKCMWTVAYLDGKHPSIVMSRGIYERIKLEAWDFDGTSLTKRWAFDSDPDGLPTEYHGQGNHNLSLADVDQDGKDEVIYASMVVDDDGNGLYSTGLGHGDALHVLDMDPERSGLEIWACLEQDPAWGATYRNAGTGEVMLHYILGRDMGRCAAGDITDEHKGVEMWGGKDKVFWNTKGEVIGESPANVNFMIWWDGDILREFCDHEWLGTEIGSGIGEIRKYNGTSVGQLLLKANGTYSNNYTKGTPIIQADIMGDWREEVVWRSTDNSFMRLFTTTIATEHRIPTLMHDPQYRIAVAWQNNSYNQPPHVGFYLAAEMDEMVPYPISNNKTIWNSGSTWDLNTSLNWEDDDGNSITFNNGDDVLFDITGENSNPIEISGDLAPRTLTFTSPSDYEIGGNGALTSNMALYKAGTGRLSLNNKNTYTGVTKVLYGELAINDTLENSHITVGMFGKLFANGHLGNGLVVNADAKLYIGDSVNKAFKASMRGNLELNKNSTTYFALSDDTSGNSKVNSQFILDGNLVIGDDIILDLIVLDDSLSWGTYELIKFTGSFTGNTETIIVKGIRGVPFQLGCTDSSLYLEILEPRGNATIKWTGGLNDDIWDLTLTKNWSYGGNQDWFLRHDSLIFDNTGTSNSSITLEDGDMEPASIEVNSAANYSFGGKGYITGSTGITKSGTGNLTINTFNDYTGPNIINGGAITVPSLGMEGKSGYLGASDNSAPGIQLNGGAVKVTATNSNSDRDILIGPKGGELYINVSAKLQFLGGLLGEGELVKSGYGQLNLYYGNDIDGIKLTGGDLYLATEDAITNGPGDGPVTLESGTLSMVNSTGISSVPWDIVVPEGASATLELKETCQLTGSMTGSGNLSLYTPGTKAELLGDWSAFEGNILASTDESGRLLLGNKAGYGKTSFRLGNNVIALYRHTSNDTVEIGSITGSLTSRLGAGGDGEANITWKIGGNDKSFSFYGSITELQVTETGATTSIIKTGAGVMTLGNESFYTGPTVVEQGRLIVNNTTGSGTGTGKVTILKGSTLGGNGTINGNVEVKDTATLSPGNGGIGIITINNNVAFSDGSYYLVDVDRGSLNADKIVSTGTINANGILYLTISGNGELQENDSIKVLEADTIRGNFKSISPLAPSSNLKWDLSTINVDGYLRVKDKNNTGVSSTNNENSWFDIYPNPTTGILRINFHDKEKMVELKIRDITGKIIYIESIDIYVDYHHIVDISSAEKGIYFLQIDRDTGSSSVKLAVN